MLTNDDLRLNLRLFVTLEHGLKQVRVLGAREFGPLAIMGVANGGEELRAVLEAGDINHYLNCSGDPFLGNCTVEAVEKSPQAMVERLEAAVRNAKALPPYLIVCSSMMRTRQGLEAIHEWFEANKQEKTATSAVIVQKEIERATALGRVLQDLLVGKQLALGATGQRDKLLAGFWALIVDYHEGMLGLMTQKLYGSAFALLRPTVEALIRAHVILFGSQDVVDQITADDYATKFRTVGAEIDAAFGYKRAGGEGLFERFLKDKNVLHSFTHSGMPQVGRRFNGADLEVNFENEEVINFAHISTAALALVTILLTNQFGLKEEATEADRLFVEWGGQRAVAAP